MVDVQSESIAWLVRNSLAAAIQYKGGFNMPDSETKIFSHGRLRRPKFLGHPSLVLVASVIIFLALLSLVRKMGLQSCEDFSDSLGG